MRHPSHLAIIQSSSTHQQTSTETFEINNSFPWAKMTLTRCCSCSGDYYRNARTRIIVYSVLSFHGQWLMWWWGSEALSRQVLAVLLCKYLYFHFSPRSQSLKIRQNIRRLINLNSNQPLLWGSFSQIRTHLWSCVQLLSCHEIAIESPDALIHVKRVHTCAHEIFIHVLSTMTMHWKCMN